MRANVQVMTGDAIQIPPDLAEWLDGQAVVRGQSVATFLLGILREAMNNDIAAKAEQARINRPPDIWSGIEAEAMEQRRA